MIEYNSALEGINDIQKRNYAFDCLPNSIKRREIAWDAYNLVLKETVNPSIGAYWDPDLQSNAYESESPEELQKYLLDVPKCSACARGLMMISLIRLGNTVSPEDRCMPDGDEGNIRGFDYNDFVRMENEYENDRYGHPYNIHTREKLMNICANVIHNGNFFTEDKTDYLK